MKLFEIDQSSIAKHIEAGRLVDKVIDGITFTDYTVDMVDEIVYDFTFDYNEWVMQGEVVYTYHAHMAKHQLVVDTLVGRTTTPTVANWNGRVVYLDNLPSAIGRDFPSLLTTIIDQLNTFVTSEPKLHHE